MGNWVTLRELGERKCTSIKIEWSSISGIDDSGNYQFTREYGVQGEEWGTWGSGFRFDLTAKNVCDFNINGGSDTFYRDLNAETYQGEYNGKEYYITYDGEYVQWEWTEPVYYYGFGRNDVGTFDPEPYAADYIYVMLEVPEVPEEPEVPEKPEKPMTIADNLNRIIQAKADIKVAIENKGITVGDISISEYAAKIDEISGGGNGFDFSVIGYNATLERELNSVTNADIEYSLSKYNEWNPSNKSAKNFFANDTKLVYAPAIDMSNVTIVGDLFYKCTNLQVAPDYNTPKLEGSNNYMFSLCTALKKAPYMNLSKVTTLSYMFDGCSKLEEIPQYDTSKVTTMTFMFNGCEKLKTIPMLDTSKVTNMSSMFGNCKSLTTIPQLDMSIVTNITSMFSNCSSLTSLPLLDWGNVLAGSLTGALFGYSDINSLTDLGGFKNLKVDWNSGYGLVRLPNLTYQSVLNVINNLYDFRANGDSSTTRTLKVNSKTLALLSDGDKAIATSKGWLLTA